MSNYIISPLACRELDEFFDYFVSSNIEGASHFLHSYVGLTFVTQQAQRQQHLFVGFRASTQPTTLIFLQI